MSGSLQPLTSQLQSSCTVLLSELQAAITNADDTTFTTIVGKRCCVAGRVKPKAIQDTIKASNKISDAFGTDSAKNVVARKAIRSLIDHYCGLAGDSVKTLQISWCNQPLPRKKTATNRVSETEARKKHSRIEISEN